MQIPYNPQNPATIKLLFTRIARNYDLTNHVISFGLDVLWRRKFARLFHNSQRVADICCGSGAMFPLLKERMHAGVDFTKAMLDVAADRFRSSRLVQGDAQKLPLQSSAFDAACIVYSIRNIPDLDAALQEIFRILQPGGMLAILDFGVPQNVLLRKLYLLYFRHIMPFIGSWVARDRASYHYFVNSVLHFPKRHDFLAHMEAAGFRSCRFTEFTAGAAISYVGQKPG